MSSIDLSAMLEKRREVVGSGDKFPVTFGEKTYYFIAPELASSEWNDEYDDFRTDVEEGVIDSRSSREEMAHLILGDQAEEFIQDAEAEGIDPGTMIGWAMRQHTEDVQENPTHRSSRNTRKRSKRR